VGLCLPAVLRAPGMGEAHAARNIGVRVMFLPELSKFGQCVHKIVLHESRAERLSCQNHWGHIPSKTVVIRGGTSRVGCPRILVRDANAPHDAGLVYIVPWNRMSFAALRRAFTRLPHAKCGWFWEAWRGAPKRGIRNSITRCLVVRLA